MGSKHRVELDCLALKFGCAGHELNETYLCLDYKVGITVMPISYGSYKTKLVHLCEILRTVSSTNAMFAATTTTIIISCLLIKKHMFLNMREK